MSSWKPVPSAGMPAGGVWARLLDGGLIEMSGAAIDTIGAPQFVEVLCDPARPRCLGLRAIAIDDPGPLNGTTSIRKVQRYGKRVRLSLANAMRAAGFHPPMSSVVNGSPIGVTSDGGVLVLSFAEVLARDEAHMEEVRARWRSERGPRKSLGEAIREALAEEETR